MGKKILLTGAGFTQNFGGFLANDMWSIIFNNASIQAEEKLRKQLLKNYDFEALYTEIINNSSQVEKTVFAEAVYNAYSIMNESIYTRNSGSCENTVLDKPLLKRVFEFIQKFSASSDYNGSGYIFTLNQDLFVEYLFEWMGEITLIPGLNSVAHKGKFSPTTNYNLPTQQELDDWRKKHFLSYQNRNNPLYIKLHGSYSWRYNADESDIMVIGGQKKEQIQKEPLLQFNFDLFEKEISNNSNELMIIGYSFRDKHINSILIDGISSGLRLHIINPLTIEDFKEYLLVGNVVTKKAGIGQKIYNAIHGYYNTDLNGIFSNHTINHFNSLLQKNYFEGDKHK